MSHHLHGAARRRQLFAIAALVLLAAALADAAALVAEHLLQGLVTFATLAGAVVAGASAAIRRGARRVAWATAAGGLLAAFTALLLTSDAVGHVLGFLAIVVLMVSAGREALRVAADLPPAPRPRRAVLFWNPRSGGGKAVKADLAEEARRRGIEAVELRPGDDLCDLVDAAIARGADALAAAGGDGTQAVVATAAAAHDLPYACIPAGTRNHFALDLGVDRDDVVGALDALVDGRERRVDLAEVNGRVFVNNVSLGVYADAVQRAGYREAKLRTIYGALPDTLGPDGKPLDLRWTDADGHSHATAAIILVSNNPYRLRAVAGGTRPRLDTGHLGVAVFDRPDGDEDRPPLSQWAPIEFAVDSGGPIPAALDGEAVTLQAPVRFASRPGALRVRIAAHHPGASPSAGLPDSFPAAVAEIARIARGRGAPITPSR